MRAHFDRIESILAALRANAEAVSSILARVK